MRSTADADAVAAKGLLLLLSVEEVERCGRSARERERQTGETIGELGDDGNLFVWVAREQKADFLSKCLAERKRSHAYDDDDDGDVCPYCTTFFLGEEGERESGARLLVVRWRGTGLPCPVEAVLKLVTSEEVSMTRGRDRTATTTLDLNHNNAGLS